MKNVFISHLMLLLLLGCVSFSPEEAKNTIPKGLKNELINIANCYEDAVYLLQNEPIEPEGFPLFLLKAKEKLSQEEQKSEGNFFALKWDPSKNHILTSSGERVKCRVVNQLQYLDDDGCHWQTTYRFYVPSKEEYAEGVVSMTFPW